MDGGCWRRRSARAAGKTAASGLERRPAGSLGACQPPASSRILCFGGEEPERDKAQVEITFGDLWDRRWELHGAGRPAPGSLGHLGAPSSALFGAVNRVGGSSSGCGVLVLGTHPLLPPDFPPSLSAPPSLWSLGAAAPSPSPPGLSICPAAGHQPLPTTGAPKTWKCPRGSSVGGSGAQPAARLGWRNPKKSPR